MIIRKNGVAIRLRISDLRVMGRATQGVRLIQLKGSNDSIAAVAKIEKADREEDEEYESIDGEALPNDDSEE